ncbi:hypothetical protein YC2023_050506 [Brassica napus]
MEEELPYEGEGIDFGESAPQTERDDHTYNPEEENAGEEADEVQGNEQSQSKSTVDRVVQEINQYYSLEETEPSKIQDHWLLIPKVEETSESKKEPDYEKAITVLSESLNPYPFARMQKIDKLAATSSASLVKVAERKKSRLQYQANHPPPKYEENRILVLPQNLRSPFEHGTQVKGVLNRYAKLYTVQIKYFKPEEPILLMFWLQNGYKSSTLKPKNRLEPKTRKYIGLYRFFEDLLTPIRTR